MDQPRVFKLPLSEGMQTIRLDGDSVDYDWKGQSRDFHGTLPYENLRLKIRITRKEKTYTHAALLIGAAFGLVLLLLPDRFAHYALVGGAVLITNLVVFLIREHLRGARICVQIEPRPFGFSGELPVPDSKAGRAFLDALESAWSESLRRRFLVADANPAVRLQRINWLQFIGVLSDEEAMAERERVEPESDEPTLIEGFAIN